MLKNQGRKGNLMLLFQGPRELLQNLGILVLPNLLLRCFRCFCLRICPHLLRILEGCFRNQSSNSRFRLTAILSRTAR